VSDSSPPAPWPALRFVSPPGWPAPSDDWVLRNQGYQPPTGWLPPGAAPERVPTAPANWQFWRPDDVGWRARRAPFVRSGVRALAIGWSLVALGVAFTVVSLLGILGGGFVAMFGLVVAGVIEIIRGSRKLLDADRSAWRGLGASMPEFRDDLDAEAHREYLSVHSPQASAAEDPTASALITSVSALARERELRPWRFPGEATAPKADWAAGRVLHPAEWPGTRWAQDPPWVVARRLSTEPRRRRIRIGVLSGLAVALALAIAIPLIVNPSHTLTDSSLPAKAAGPGPSNVLVTATDWNVVASGKCSAALGCWQLTVTPESSCRDAVIVWGFTLDDHSAVATTRSTNVSLVSGDLTHVTVPITSSIAEDQYIQLDDASCRG
jgi:hypothetical protein